MRAGGLWRSSGTVILKSEDTLESLREFVNAQIVGPYTRIFDSIGLGRNKNVPFEQISRQF